MEKGVLISKQLTNYFFQIKGAHMKRLLLLSLTSLMLIFSACKNEGPITGPEMSGSQKISKAEPNWIILPVAENITLKKDASVGQMIYGNQETLLQINTGYAGGPHYWVSITANARFQRKSFVGSRYIAMSVNDSFGCATFSPSGTFLLPVIYNLTIVGADLSGINPVNVGFYYIAADGSYQKAQCDKIIVDVQAGRLQVINALLPHFSTYGFGV